MPQRGQMPDTEEARSRGAEYAALRDADLIVAMRSEERRAFVEFIERFRILAWNQACDLRVGSAERRSWTEEVLHDCALSLVRDGAPIPGNLAGYVVIAARRKFFKQFNKARDEQRMIDEMGDQMSGSSADRMELPVSVLPEPVMRLVDGISATLSDEEELLLVWKGHRISYSTIAEWLGESRSAVAQRIWRLTKRLVGVTETIVASFNEDDRELIRHFLHDQEERKSEES